MVMEPIRWEESKQLDYIPSKLKVIVHRRAVYACPEKHDHGYEIRTVQEPLGHGDVRTAMIYTHVLKRGGNGVRSPVDRLAKGLGDDKPQTSYHATNFLTRSLVPDTMQRGIEASLREK
jgi:hypothetical protein